VPDHIFLQIKERSNFVFLAEDYDAKKCLTTFFESRSLPLLASQAGSLNGCLDSMPEWLSWSCWDDWLLAVPDQDHSVHGLATAAPWIAGSRPADPAESSVSRASDARCAQVGQEGKD
jgi:hypothetical protein